MSGCGGGGRGIKKSYRAHIFWEKRTWHVPTMWHVSTEGVNGFLGEKEPSAPPQHGMSLIVVLLDGWFGWENSMLRPHDMEQNTVTNDLHIVIHEID